MSNTVEIIITAEATKALSKLGAITKSLGAIGVAAAAAAVAIGGIAVASVKAFASFESAFAGVRKTIDGTEQDFAILAKGIRDMAQEIPSSVEEIAKIAESAGQLGIAKENVLDFTRTMVDLGNATNLVGEQGAVQLARLANITKLPQDQFDELGSTIVALGNNLATTEAEITEMALRLAGAGTQIGLSESQILSFSGALSSVGISAEAGGTAFSRVMVDIANSVATGGKKLTEFAKVSGLSINEFKTLFEEDAAGALISFTEGLDRTAKSGGNVFKTLEDLGLSNVRVRDALLRASGAGDLFRKSLEIGSKAWEENTALAEEANKRYETLASKFQITKNIINDVAISIGQELAPAFISMLEVVQVFAKNFGKLVISWPEVIQISMNAITEIFNKSWLEIAQLIAKVSSVIWVPLGEAFSVIGSNIEFGWRILMINVQQMVNDTVIGAAKLLEKIPFVPKSDLSGLLEMRKVLNEAVLDTPKTMSEAYEESIDTIKGMFISLSEDPAISGFKEKIITLLDEVELTAVEFSETTGEAIVTGLTGGEEGGETIRDFWAEMGEFLKEGLFNIADVAQSTWDQFQQGFGDAIGNAIVKGEDLGTSLGNLFKDILASFISMIVQMTVRWLAFTALTGGAGGAFGGFGGFSFAGGGVIPGGLQPVSAATGGVFKKPTLAVIGDNPERQEAVIPMRNGKVGVELKGGNQGGGGIQIGTLNFMPGASISKDLMDQPPEYWEAAFKKNILPAMNSLGSNGTTTTMQPRAGRV